LPPCQCPAAVSLYALQLHIHYYYCIIIMSCPMVDCSTL
jgi:hypothetical protein